MMANSIYKLLNMFLGSTLIVMINHLFGCASNVKSEAVPYQTESAAWYKNGRQRAQELDHQTPQTNQAKNIILFIGDGMGISTVTAARIFAGQQQGLTGEEYLLSFESFPHTALVKTYNTDQQTPDSAGTMTAIMTGVKTRAGLIGVSDKVKRGNCQHFQEAQLMSALMLAESQGKATGIVTTARLTHATPAATYAHSADRDFEDDSINSECGDIAKQLVDFPYGDGIDVALGGGERHFIPKSQGGSRLQENLIKTWQQRGNVFVSDQQSLLNYDPVNHVNKPGHLLGLFAPSHMAYEADREKTPTGQPSLRQMTNKAIDILSQDPDGFFLVVESGRIDHAHHNGNAYRALSETEMFSKTVSDALTHAGVNREETLIIVTADHSHTLTMAGYPTRGNPILGMVIGNDESGLPKEQPELALDHQPYTTLSYINGPGAHISHDHKTSMQRSNARLMSQVSKNMNTEDKDYIQESLIPLELETHSAEDVGVWATGPWAQLVRGNLEQNVLFHIMNFSAKLTTQP